MDPWNVPMHLCVSDCTYVNTYNTMVFTCLYVDLSVTPDPLPPSPSTSAPMKTPDPQPTKLSASLTETEQTQKNRKEPMITLNQQL